MKQLELRSLGDLKNLTDSDKDNLKLTNNEASWLKVIKVPSKILSPLFRNRSHIEEKWFNEDFMAIPVRSLIYRDRKNVLAFVRNYDIRMSIEHVNINGIDMVLVLHGAYDNPLNPFVVESYFNPYFEEEGERPFLNDLRYIAETGFCLSVGHVYKRSTFQFEGVSYFEVTPEFLEKTKGIYSTLIAQNKRQSVDEFLRVKYWYQQFNPLHHHSINWLGDFAKSIRMREFMN